LALPLVEELGHPLFLADDALGQLHGLAIADGGGEGFDPPVDGDLDVLLAQLLLRVAQVRLGLAGDHGADAADLALTAATALPASSPTTAGTPGIPCGPLVALPPSFGDALTDLPLVVVGLLQMLAQASGRF
jgi:hypothetical protein